MGVVDGKVALITGGAKGLGGASARLLAKEGAKLVITDIDEAEAEKNVAAIEKEGGEAVFFKHDVTDEEGWGEVMAKSLERFGKLDVLVNNAGVGLIRSVEDTTLDQWRWVMKINLEAVFIGTKLAILAMKETGGGSIINISSIEGIIGDESAAAYNASKGGVRIFTKSAALHCGRQGYGIRVNSIHPGYIRTPLMEKGIKKMGDRADAWLERVTALHPIGHLGEPNDIANGVLYLASDGSKFVTGSELVIDGGYTAR